MQGLAAPVTEEHDKCSSFLTRNFLQAVPGLGLDGHVQASGMLPG